MSTALGQPIIIDNKGGADGASAGEYVARSVPDGYTLFMATNSPIAAVPILLKNPPYNSATDFTPTSFVGRTTFYLVVNAELPVKSVDELIKYSKTNPGKLNYASSSTTGIVSMAQSVRSDGTTVDDDNLVDHALGVLQIGLGKNDRHALLFQIGNHLDQPVRERRRHAFERLIEQQ